MLDLVALRDFSVEAGERSLHSGRSCFFRVVFDLALEGLGLSLQFSINFGLVDLSCILVKTEIAYFVSELVEPGRRQVFQTLTVLLITFELHKSLVLLLA